VKLLFTVLLVAALANPLPARTATPFKETGAIGETVTASGWVITRGSSNLQTPTSEGDRFVVLVLSGCTEEFVALEAEAKEGVVPEALLGRPVRITARIVEKYIYKQRALEILHVSDGKTEP
jgi:hypothetical protein